MAMDEALSLQGEKIHAIAAQLLHRRHLDGCRGIAVCGVSAGEGATFLAVKLASAIAQNGVSTGLVDLDLNGPGVEALVQGDPEVPGVTDFLTDPDLEIADLVQATPEPNLMILQAGRREARTSDLIEQSRLERLIQGCMRMFEFTVVDTPPANRAADLIRIIDAVGYVVIIARRDQAYTDDVAILAQQVRETGAQLLGSVLVEA